MSLYESSDQIEARSTALVRVDAQRAELALRQSEVISRALRKAARQVTSTGRVVSGAIGSKARRGERRFRQAIVGGFVLLVVIPVIAAGIYWGLIASPQYATQAKFALRSGEGSPLDQISGLIGISVSQQSQDTQIVANYIESRAMVDVLDRDGSFHTAYMKDGVDFYARLSSKEPMEELERYWRRFVNVRVEPLPGIVTVTVRAFTPEDSLKLADKVVSTSERLVNDLSLRARRSMLDQSRTELVRAEGRLQKATAALRVARDSEGVLDANTSAQALGQVITTLELQLAQTRQQYDVQIGVDASAPHKRLLKTKMDILNGQIGEYQRQIASGSGGQSLANAAGRLSPLQTDLEIARKAYAQASASYEAARMEVESDPSYFALFLKPTLAQNAEYPHRLLEWSVISGIAFALWALLTCLAFYIRNNMVK